MSTKTKNQKRPVKPARPLKGTWNADRTMRLWGVTNRYLRKSNQYSQYLQWVTPADFDVRQEAHRLLMAARHKAIVAGKFAPKKAAIHNWEWFRSKCKKDRKGCLIWNQSKTWVGYGQCSIKVDGEWETHSAHRVAYCLHNNVCLKDIKGKEVAHVCPDTGTHRAPNRACCNPEHLTLMNHQENSSIRCRPMISIKTDDGVVANLKWEWLSGNAANQSVATVAGWYGAKAENVYRIKSGKSYKNIRAQAPKGM